MSWLFSTTQWYFYLLVLGVIFFPLTKKIFASFFDKGYAFSKTIGILALTYTTFIFGTLKLLPFERASIILILSISAVLVWYFFYFKDKDKEIPWKMIIFEEILFIVCLLSWTYVRGQEPSIRGLEKFMDFGFINSILKSSYFPPLDMWYSADNLKPGGYPINYYYFGHLAGAEIIKLTETLPSIGYNLILATLFALGVTESFSLILGLVSADHIKEIAEKTKEKITKSSPYLFFIAAVGAYIANLGGNLHTIYLFTTGYPNENPIPFWQILSSYNPTKYWYPNATRFIPFTIHEFPSYSYVVADLHGHVFDIPFVLLTLALIFIFFRSISPKKDAIFSRILQMSTKDLSAALMLGFMTSIHYMTNAFDGPIYLLLIFIVFYFVYKISYKFFSFIGVTLFSFIIFSLPFSIHFSPFAKGIGLNCSPTFLTNIGKFGPFLFEKGNCQISPPWMFFVLWGFFWINLIIFALLIYLRRNIYQKLSDHKSTDLFILLLFTYGTFLIIIPEFFYIKDIYPAHFRANTMFKLGYQAFIMMSIGSAYVLHRIKEEKKSLKILFSVIFTVIFLLIFVFPIFSVPSYYGNLQKTPELDGSLWANTAYPESKEIIDYINKNLDGHPVILEAQGDSYTDYNLISAYTGFPTVAGWWVHEWLWRGSSDVVGKRIPDIVNLYESSDINLTKDLIKKYNITYIVVSSQERTKYKNLNENKIEKIGKKIFSTSDNSGALYQVNFY